MGSAQLLVDIMNKTAPEDFVRAVDPCRYENSWQLFKHVVKEIEWQIESNWKHSVLTTACLEHVTRNQLAA